MDNEFKSVVQQAEELERTELSDKFLDKRMDNGTLVESFHRLGEHARAQKVSFCGTELDFRVFLDASPPKLYRANFCKDRLCRMCAWRRSKKIFGQLSSIMDVLEDEDYRFVFATLTIRNGPSEELAFMLKALQSGFNKFLQRAPIRRAFKGVFKTVEITRNEDRIKSIEWHPHIHMVVAVKKSYFKSKDYISHDTLMSIWRDCCHLDYDPSVEIHKIRPRELNNSEDGEMSFKGAVLEVSKYTLKGADYLSGHERDIDRVVALLGDVLTGRRLCSFTGVFKKVAKQLKLDDMMDGDLVNTDNEKIRHDVACMIVQYRWQTGIGYRWTHIRPMTDDEKEKLK